MVVPDVVDVYRVEGEWNTVGPGVSPLKEGPGAVRVRPVRILFGRDMRDAD